jgi:hypothetical protein
MEHAVRDELDVGHFDQPLGRALRYVCQIFKPGDARIGWVDGRP